MPAETLAQRSNEGMSRRAGAHGSCPGRWCLKAEGDIAQDHLSQKVADILKRKKASIKQARLPRGSPDWEAFMEMTWEQIEAGARANRPGFKVVRKLLTDKRFDK
jgi:hypothetical protein